ncbi:MAG: bifunctional DedA family/phosphatase PAP2 family protein, partial [Candidatus Thiodiazotropha taylori]|nr:bifunctional DedA family/phosphatase PAP2 family protein [Candidatus Thiodiazotropha endolucinida]MCW4230104.1 bifunctional DedA family/phosphatase PAP2 family protein [Candidatus Thiodiazotropha taylori]
SVFLVAFSESVAIVGLLVPGVIAMFGFGALIATGTLQFWPVFWWAVAGAVAGDSLSFWLGRHYQDGLRQIWPFSRYPETLHRGIRFFEKYGGKSVAIGRFFGPVRAIIPLVAGMMGMTPMRFLLANISSALVWAPAYLLPGIVFGASLELASEVTFRLVILLLLILALAWGLFKLAHALFRLLQPHARDIVQWGFDWGQRHRGFRAVSAALADPDHPEAKGLAFLATLLLLATLLFMLLLGAMVGGTLMQSANEIIHNGLQSLRTPWGDQFIYLLTSLGDLSTIIIVAVVSAILLILQGHYRTLNYLLAAIAFGILAPLLLKYGLQIPRPESAPATLGPWSFPSAHVLRSITLYGFLSIMVARGLSHDWRWLPYSIAATLVGAVALSRLYLGVHWLSDVLGSITLGLAWIALLGIAYARHVSVESRHFAIVVASLTTLALYLTFQTWQLPEKLQPYQQQAAINQIESQLAWRSGQLDIPTHRHDIRGEGNHPLNLQYVGDLQILQQQLQRQGWQSAEMLDWGNALKLLSPSTPLIGLPLLPHVHDARHEALVMTKNLNTDRRLVMRLWKTDVSIDSPDKPLYVGNVSSQQVDNSFGILVVPRTETDFQLARNRFQEDQKSFDAINHLSAPGTILLFVD